MSEVFMMIMFHVTVLWINTVNVFFFFFTFLYFTHHIQSYTNDQWWWLRILLWYITWLSGPFPLLYKGFSPSVSIQEKQIFKIIFIFTIDIGFGLTLSITNLISLIPKTDKTNKFMRFQRQSSGHHFTFQSLAV